MLIFITIPQQRGIHSFKVRLGILNDRSIFFFSVTLFPIVLTEMLKVTWCVKTRNTIFVQTTFLIDISLFSIYDRG